MTFHKSLVGLALFSLFALGQTANAGQCGGGKILDIKEGGWNNDHFAIQVDNSVYSNDHPGTHRTIGAREYIIFEAHILSKERLEAIRRVAYLAYATNSNVYTHTHRGTCRSATELSLVAMP